MTNGERDVRAGAAAGGVIGFVPPLVAGWAAGGGPVPPFDLAAMLLVMWAFFGALCGLLGGNVLAWVRGRRAAAWPDFLTGLAGGYPAGLAAGTATALF